MRKTAIIFSLIILFIGTQTLPVSADSQFSVLPLGPSKHKYKIQKIEKDQIVQTATGKIIPIDDIINQNPKTDVFIIGEAHDNYQCHTFQRDFIEALFKKHQKVMVGFEFFWREDNELLGQWSSGKLSEEELIEKTGWYKRGGQNYALTRLVMDLIKENKIKVIGLNVPRTILRTVSRKGFDNLSKEEKELFPTLNIPNPEHKYFIKSVFGTFAAQVPMWFENVYTAQTCWDVIMAESMRKLLSKKEYKGYKGVIIAGANHVNYNLGIPFRYKKASPRSHITTIVPILLPREGEKKEEDEDAHPMMKMMGKHLPPASTFSRGIADYVFSALQPKYYHHPTLGFFAKEQKGTLEITRVAKKSIAEKQGIKKGDKIIAIDGVEVKTMEQMRLLLTKKVWDDSVEIKLVKKIDIKKEDDKDKNDKKDKKEKKE